MAETAVFVVDKDDNFRQFLAAASSTKNIMNNITPKMATARFFLTVASASLSIFCLGVHPAHAQTEPSQDKQLLYQVDYVPLRKGDAVLGQPLVQVKINGTQDALFLVDTGSSAGIISTELAKRLSLRLEPALDKG